MSGKLKYPNKIVNSPLIIANLRDLTHGILRSYVLGLLYSIYSRSTCSKAVATLELLASGWSFTSGYISASQASPPTVSQASAGKTLRIDAKCNFCLITTTGYWVGK
uniref:Uncharacterized protein MANES_09G187300 n=1 Tax=Rhizophora mucronata TaxID=61149 RepID=A0A2P2JFJ0_RHIMU